MLKKIYNLIVSISLVAIGCALTYLNVAPKVVGYFTKKLKRG